MSKNFSVSGLPRFVSNRELLRAVGRGARPRRSALPLDPSDGRTPTRVPSEGAGGFVAGRLVLARGSSGDPGAHWTEWGRSASRSREPSPPRQASTEVFLALAVSAGRGEKKYHAGFGGGRSPPRPRPVFERAEAAAGSGSRPMRACLRLREARLRRASAKRPSRLDAVGRRTGPGPLIHLSGRQGKRADWAATYPSWRDALRAPDYILKPFHGRDGVALRRPPDVVLERSGRIGVWGCSLRAGLGPPCS